MKRIGSFLNIKIVTIDWLKECFMQEKILDEDAFRPESTTTNGAMHQELKKDKKNYKIKQNIFNGKTFAIQEESFINADLKDNDAHIVDAHEQIQRLERNIIENSGRVITD